MGMWSTGVPSWCLLISKFERSNLRSMLWYYWGIAFGFSTRGVHKCWGRLTSLLQPLHSSGFQLKRLTVFGALTACPSYMIHRGWIVQKSKKLNASPLVKCCHCTQNLDTGAFFKDQSFKFPRHSNSRNIWLLTGTKKIPSFWLCCAVQCHQNVGWNGRCKFDSRKFATLRDVYSAF